ncbi:FecR family protein [Flavihumibacter sediminis]|nr:FecR family protein [Flavihumibacter sediminis]
MKSILSSKTDLIIQPSPRARALLSGFFCNILTDEEEEELDHWILESKENMTIFEEWLEKDINDPGRSFINNADIKRLLKKPFFTPQLIRAAVFIGLIVSITGLTWYQRGRNPIELVTAGDNVHRRPVETSKQFHAPAGAPTLFTFPDSTTVLLDPGSTVNYPSIFPKHERRIELKGRAEFNSRKEKRRWFRVKLNEYELISDGGRFIAEWNPQKDSVHITAIKEILKFTHGKDQWIIEPGESAIYHNNTWKKFNQ